MSFHVQAMSSQPYPAAHRPRIRAPSRPSTVPQATPTTGRQSSGNEELCNSCYASLDFEQFALGRMRGVNGVPPSAMGPATTALISLFDIIKNSVSGCPFCGLLLDAMKQPENDPFQHPAVRDYMPNEFRGVSFAAWLESIRRQGWLERMNQKHPFGSSRNKVELALDESAPGGIREIRRSDLEAQEQAALATSAAGAGAGLTAASQSKNEAKTVISAAGGVGGIISTGRLIMLNGKLPVVVRIKMFNIKDQGRRGLLNISIHGYGCRVQAPLSVLSSFSLRVASDYRRDNLGLSYGKIIQEHVHLEDCRAWLSNCCQHHECGSPNWYRNLPSPRGQHFRLVEIDDRRDVMFRVVRVETVPEYAALSYVWGDAGRNALNLRENNVEELSKRIPAGRLARTVSDAIKVTRGLGLRYIWVDSLCIIQQDPLGRSRNQEELEARQSQLDQMGSIFGHAKVVIVAAGGDDAGSGLAGVSQFRKPVQVARTVSPNVNVLLAAQYDGSYGKWDTRAWTLQEKLMSRRMLVFGHSYVSFHCRHGVLREDMPALHAGNGPPAMPQLSALEDRADARARKRSNGSYVLLRSPYFDEYTKLMEHYTWRERTERSDVLVAILGLLKVLEDTKRPQAIGQGHNTLQGLPEEFLDLALLWQPPAALGARLSRKDELFPSWSWTGWEFSSQKGIRFEQPFHVSGYDDMSLRKFVASGSAEERTRPLVMWYKWRQGRLIGVNDSGLGIVCGMDAAISLFEKPLRFRHGFPNLIPTIQPHISLDERHLVCETEVRRFNIRPKTTPRKEVIWERGDGRPVVSQELEIIEAEILDVDGTAVGHVIPTDQDLDICAATLYTFILLSESQYWGNEERIDVVGYPLYNVMMVTWDSSYAFATRIGLGKILKGAWNKERRDKTCIILK
ncbi:heterokaryon incompatibility protein-domain-containing protein [Stachybotrys elegans]|uniref:Heterokaryon incompatibility protein-domain-containing protein n=1 Tax=Stachybotrys elegans TaxID=80388 RepID=A0A8K0T5J1_9HYPO|nr:heterokaryon incompatibility protein-domain-containing protein [Stachybotrys elegans]